MYTAHIVIERPLEKVFLWMLQPQHIAQLVTLDITEYYISNSPLPPPEYNDDPKYDDSEDIERIAKQQRFLEQAQTKIEIEHLSTPTLHVGTTFEYSMSIRDWPKESPEFLVWKRMYTGSITIQKSVPSTFFAFTAKRPSLSSRFSRPTDHHLAFQAQQERTIITYTQLTRTGEVASMIESALISGLTAFRRDMVWRQLLHLQTQMDVEID
jgi:hypothetical protein